MKLNVKIINFETGNVKVVVLNSKDAANFGGKAGDRVRVKNLSLNESKDLIAILDISYSDSIIAPGEVGIFLDTGKTFKLSGQVSVTPAEPPDSFKFIKRLWIYSFDIGPFLSSSMDTGVILSRRYSLIEFLSIFSCFE